MPPVADELTLLEYRERLLLWLTLLLLLLMCLNALAASAGEKRSPDDEPGSTAAGEAGVEDEVVASEGERARLA